jgi:hypothetical protein
VWWKERNRGDEFDQNMLMDVWKYHNETSVHLICVKKQTPTAVYNLNVKIIYLDILYLTSFE